MEGVFFCGSNKSGQCGRRPDRAENPGANPRFFQFDALERFGSPAVKVSCGFDHSMVLLQDGRVLAFGNGWDGQLGTENFQSNHVPLPVPQEEGVEFVDIEAKGE